MNTLALSRIQRPLGCCVSLDTRFDLFLYMMIVELISITDGEFGVWVSIPLELWEVASCPDFNTVIWGKKMK